MPVIVDIRAITKNTVRVQFDSPIINNPAYLDPDNYIFNEGLESIGIAVVESDTVDLITTTQKTDRFYILEFKRCEKNS